MFKFYNFFLFAICMSANAIEIPKKYYGEYCISEVFKYRGGLTTEAEAKSWLGKNVSLSNTQYVGISKTIESPTYKYSKSPNKVVEGQVPGRTRLFWGVFPARTHLTQIDVFEPEDLVYPYTTFEIVNDNKFFELYDGYVYVLSKSCL
ncbi:hypothetical protein PRUB_a0636 [Pseudoalteromonas rubra]|uniref:Uncharacterized protein n=1 Tax=Pseudoalteromonas rubra TaxID=43658 RepID=A0A8T0C641_9GAMM|nr:hypothetical protein [Pseudoalteromonas rubra]KAF7786159.1 hypothetical protein PRUB_a0636 [Pseudoalteromonas rubra]